MSINLLPILLAGFLASLIWFLIGVFLYMNPVIAKIYKKSESSPALKKWKSTPKYVGLQYVGMLIQCLLWAFVFAFVQPVLTGDFWQQGFFFGLILVAVKIIPRLYDMWIQSTYPNKLLAIEFVNGAIGSFVVGISLAYFL